jgi:hypothetical protein
MDRVGDLMEPIELARGCRGWSAEITMLHQPMLGIADME